MKKSASFGILLLVAILILGCQQSAEVGSDKAPTKNEEQTTTGKEQPMTKAPEMQIDKNKSYTAKIQTPKGDFELKLFPKEAPKTVNNFVYLAKKGFYDGTIFHRVIKDFMIQGGDPQGTGMGGPGYKFEDEINSIKLVRGKLAMANAGPNTNGSQFFIVTAQETPWLDGKHTVFGEVTKGLEVVLEIEKAEKDQNDRPTEEIALKKVTIEEN